MAPFSEKTKQEYFLHQGWTGQISLIRLTKIVFGRACFSGFESAGKRRTQENRSKLICPTGTDRLLISGLDPAIPRNEEGLLILMDARVKPGHDEFDDGRPVGGRSLNADFGRLCRCAGAHRPA